MEKHQNDEAPFLPPLNSSQSVQTNSHNECQKSKQADAKLQKLNAAMRANLKKRKAQLQARKKEVEEPTASNVVSPLA